MKLSINPQLHLRKSRNSQRNISKDLLNRREKGLRKREKRLKEPRKRPKKQRKKPKSRIHDEYIVFNRNVK